MAKSKILTGARAIVKIVRVENGKETTQTIGFFTTCNWSIRQDKVPAFILGRYSPAELTPTAQEAVALTMTGYRTYENGPYAIKAATQLKDLLQEEDFTVTVIDRQQDPKKPAIFTVTGCRVTGWSSGVAARGVSDMRLDVIGLLAEDETSKGDNETKGAAELSIS